MPLSLASLRFSIIASLYTSLSLLQGFSDTQSLKGVRLGVFRPWFEDADPVIVTACDRALKFLKSKGAEVVAVTIPNIRFLSLAHGIKISSEFASAHGQHYDFNEMNGKKGQPNRDMEYGSRITVGLGSTSTALEVRRKRHRGTCRLRDTGRH